MIDRLRFYIKALFALILVSIFCFIRLERENVRRIYNDKTGVLNAKIDEIVSADASQTTERIGDFLRARAGGDGFEEIAIFTSPDILPIGARQKATSADERLGNLVSGRFVAMGEIEQSPARVRDGRHIAHSVAGRRLPSADLYMSVALTSSTFEETFLWIMLIVDTFVAALLYALFSRLKAVSEELAREREQMREQALLLEVKGYNYAVLHNEISNYLYPLECNIIQLENKLSDADGIVKNNITQAKRLLNFIKNKIRILLAYNDYHQNMDILNLETEESLADFMVEYEKLVFGCEISIDEHFKNFSDRITPEQRGALKLVLTEAVSNAIKHGNASYITIRVESKDTEATLEIEDDGVGFPEQPVNTESNPEQWNVIKKCDHYGLNILQSQCKGIDAEPNIFSPRPDGKNGSMIRIKIVNVQA
jgi:signal transduction histidine kinase